MSKSGKNIIIEKQKFVFKRGGAAIRNLSSYLLFTGIFIVAIQGNWIIDNYESLAVYPRFSSYSLAVGTVMLISGYVLNRFFPYMEKKGLNRRDNRELINTLWKKGTKFDNWLIGLVILSLVIMGIYDWTIAFKLLHIYMFIGMAGIGFLFVMKGNRVDQPEEAAYGPKTKAFLNLIDYRKHPFNLSLILFLVVVSSLVMSKSMGVALNLEMDGNPRYVRGLPSLLFVLSGLMLVSTFTYIINNGDLFGIRKAKQNETNVLFIHFMEILCCGVTFFMWVITMGQAFS